MTTATKLHSPPPTFIVPPLEHAKVFDIMRSGIFGCTPDTPLPDIAWIMAIHRIHAVIVTDVDGDSGRPWGIVSDLDLAAATGPDTARMTARDVARTELVTVAPAESVQRVAQLMCEHETAHLVVVEPQSGQPIGVVSTLDVIGVLAAGGRA